MQLTHSLALHVQVLQVAETRLIQVWRPTKVCTVLFVPIHMLIPQRQRGVIERHDLNRAQMVGFDDVLDLDVPPIMRDVLRFDRYAC